MGAGLEARQVFWFYLFFPQFVLIKYLKLLWKGSSAI